MAECASLIALYALCSLGFAALNPGYLRKRSPEAYGGRRVAVTLHLIGKPHAHHAPAELSGMHHFHVACACRVFHRSGVGDEPMLGYEPIAGPGCWFSCWRWRVWRRGRRPSGHARDYRLRGKPSTRDGADAVD